ncbi:MAG: hypothetical protein ACRDPR_09155 [Nocardioidaceae bacterium]
MRFLGYGLALCLGVTTAVAVLAVHPSPPGLLLGSAATLVTLWALRQWRRPLVAWFALGWLVPVWAGLSGRSEGDYVVSQDTLGYGLLGTALVVLVTGTVAAFASGGRRDSGSGASRTYNRAL